MLATVTQIAADLGVGRRTVYGWIDRYEDFPAPAQRAAGTELRDLDEVRDWHRRNAGRLSLAWRRTAEGDDDEHPNQR